MAESSLSLGKIHHWAMMLGMIFIAAAPGGGLLTMAGNYFTHIINGLAMAPDAVSNIFNAVTTMDFTSPATAAVGGIHGGMAHGASEMATSFAACKDGLSAAQLSQATSLAAAQGVGVDSYLTSSGMCPAP